MGYCVRLAVPYLSFSLSQWYILLVWGEIKSERFFYASSLVWCLRGKFLVLVKSVRNSRLSPPCKVCTSSYCTPKTLCFIGLKYCPPHSLPPHGPPTRFIAVHSTDLSFHGPPSPTCALCVTMKLSTVHYTVPWGHITHNCMATVFFPSPHSPDVSSVRTITLSL